MPLDQICNNVKLQNNNANSEKQKLRSSRMHPRETLIKSASHAYLHYFCIAHIYLHFLKLFHRVFFKTFAPRSSSKREGVR